MTTSGDSLAEIRHQWSDAYDVGPDSEGCRAIRRDGRGVLIAPGPESLWDAMTADFAARPVLLGCLDQVGRMRRLLAANPGAEAWFRWPSWFGSYPLAGDRWLWTGAASDLGTMLDRLEEFPAMARLCEAIEAEHEGCQVRRSLDGRWRATRLEPGPVMPLEIDESNSLLLLCELAEVARVQSQRPGWIIWGRGSEWGATYPGDLVRKRLGGSVDGDSLDAVEARIADVEDAWASRDRKLTAGPGES